MCQDLDAISFSEYVSIPGRSVEAFRKSLARKKLVQIESENRAIWVQLCDAFGNRHPRDKTTANGCVLQVEGLQAIAIDSIRWVIRWLADYY